MEIIDAHAHIYPVKIAEKATRAIGDFYNLNMELTGIADKLLEEGKSAGISRFIVHSCATKSNQVRAINEFIKKEITEHPEFIGFMTLHPDMTEEEIDEEVSVFEKSGFKGIKLHPDFQRFYIDGENAEKFYRVVGDRLPFLFHTGDDRYEFSKPYRMAKMARKYKNVRFIGAHFGGYRCWDEVEVYKGIDNMWFDTSSSLPFISKQRAKELIELFGEDRFFFGTDFPMWEAKEELARFAALPISSATKDKILSINIKNFLRLS